MEALVLCDMIEDVVRKIDLLYTGEQMTSLIGNLRNLVLAANRSNKPVIFVRDFHRPTDKRYFELSGYPHHAMAATRGAEIISELKPRSEALVIRKRNISGFYGSDLEVTLRGMSVDTIVLAGLVTNGCILHTAADAYQRYFKVFVVEDCTLGKPGPGEHEWALNHIRDILRGEIVSSNEAISLFYDHGEP